jgi:type III secretory pathway component EscT
MRQPDRGNQRRVSHAEVLLEVLLRELAASGIDPMSWARAWARLVPSLVLIPILGLRAFPIPLRLVFALVLGASIAPGLVEPSVARMPPSLELASELARGLPVALSVAIGIWGASMVGELLDASRGSRSSRSVFDDDAASPLAVLLSLVAAVAFFQLSGPARLAEALATARPLSEQDLRSVALSLARGIQFAVVLAGPLLALVPFLELLHGLVIRATRPLGFGVLLGPVKTIVFLGVTALVLDRVASGVVLWLDRALPS